MADDPRLWPRCLRHLYWVCQAPSLIRHERAFDLTAALPEGWTPRMTTLSRCGGIVRVLEQAATERLGVYFEHLYAGLITGVLGWELLARNVEISEGGRTLGALDFLVRQPGTCEVEQHAIAVKFYLGAGAGDP